MHQPARIVIITSITCILAFTSSIIHAAPTEKAVLEAMKKAAGFMADTVSCNGGYVYKYSEDLSRKWGEIPARNTQIWTQPPGTPAMGRIYLDAYKATSDPVFLKYAEMAANALIWGQHPSGGWHYLIDFDMPGIRRWYDEVASQCWGWEEYYHYYGNCSFDDAATSAPVQFLLELYMTTLDPNYRVPLLKALDFIIEAQYPNGGWPQRYPLMYEYPHNGLDDYTHYYTFNDGATRNNIERLIDAYEQLGDGKYWEAAVRGMDFYIISQCGKPQAGWAQQYTMDMKPGSARTYEPAAVSTHRTLGNINDLMRFYRITSDRRYLAPIPGAIEWLENSVINTDPSKNYTHAGFYEPVTNKPLYYHFEGTSKETMRHWIDHDITDSWWYRRQITPDIEKIRRDYERVHALTPGQAQAEYQAAKDSRANVSGVDSGKVDEIISSLDSKGAWITDIQIRDYSQGMLSTPPDTIRGIDISVYLRNMNALIDFLIAKN